MSKPSGWDRPRNWDRQDFTAAERRQVLRRDRFTCYRCGGKASQVDHVVPQAEGGAHSLSNAAAICPGCHLAKSRAEAQRGYVRRQKRLRLPEEPHPFGSGPPVKE
jgi:5-methylcytosine-specific restriction enzyme A